MRKPPRSNTENVFVSYELLQLRRNCKDSGTTCTIASDQLIQNQGRWVDRQSMSSLRTTLIIINKIKLPHLSFITCINVSYKPVYPKQVVFKCARLACSGEIPVKFCFSFTNDCHWCVVESHGLASHRKFPAHIVHCESAEGGLG